MMDIYIDESGGFDRESAIFLIGAHLSCAPSSLDLIIQEFEDALYSRVDFQIFLKKFEEQGLHACSNHPKINDLFSSFLNKAEGRYAFSFTREIFPDHTAKQTYTIMLASLVENLIRKANNNGKIAHIYYETATPYLSGSTQDNSLLETAILALNPNAQIIIEGKDKKYKRLGFVDYACNIVYNNIRRCLENEKGAAIESLYSLVEQNTSFIRDINRKKTLIPRKNSGMERELAKWLS